MLKMNDMWHQHARDACVLLMTYHYQQWPGLSAGPMRPWALLARELLPQPGAMGGESMTRCHLAREVVTGTGGDMMAAWAERTGRGRAREGGRGGLRFAFTGGCRPKTGRTRSRPRRGNGTRPVHWWPGSGRSWQRSST
jgi:hypothetical protein